MQVLLLLVALCSVLLQSSDAQQLMFPWDGPTSPTIVPETAFVAPPNEAVIEFSDEGTVRTLRIGAGVTTTFDCSDVVDALMNMPGVMITPSSITTTWTFVEFDVNFASQTSLTLSDSTTYAISGTNMEMLSITNPTLPTDGGVVSGQRGEYTCQVCGTIFVLGGVGGQEACAQSTSILAIAESMPVIYQGSEIIEDSMQTFINVGNDLCILGSVPETLIIQCGHNVNGFVDPAPEATWNFPPSAAPAIDVLDNPDIIGTNEWLTIDNDGDPLSLDDIIGVYTCSLSNGMGTPDTATTELRIAPTIDRGNGLFDFDPSEGRVRVGNSTCEHLRGNQSNGVTQIRCVPSESTFDFEIMWFFNGELIPRASSNNLRNTGPGEYTCVLRLPDCAGSTNATTVILGSPTLPNVTAPPIDVTNVTYNVGQLVCLDPMVVGDVMIECPLPENADPDQTSVVWTKVGDPSFSFSGTILNLPRSDTDSVGSYICTISSGPEGRCGQIQAGSDVTVQNAIITGSGFVPNPPGSEPTIIIGSDTCFQPNLRIRCDTTSSTAVSWTRDGMSIAGGELLSVTQAGVYECSTDDGCGRTISASSEVFAMDMIAISADITSVPDSGCSRVSNGPNDPKIICPLVGERVTITCTPATDYMIFLGTTLVSTNQPLVVPSIREDEYGIYECRGAGNQCGVPTDTLQLFNGVIPPRLPPRGLNPPSFMNVSVGDNACLPVGEMVSIDCEASSGTLPIAYVWRKEPSQTVISNMRILTVSETGIYTCTATNPGGSDTGSSTVFEDIDMNFRISPSTRPSRCQDLDVPPANTDLCFFVGDSVQFICRSRVSMISGIIQPGGVMDTLVIPSLQEKDQMFSCSGSNDCGNDTANLVLLVQEPARINRMIPLPPPRSSNEIIIGAGRPDEPVEVTENVTVRLFCPFTGLDQPTTRWVRVNRDRTTTDVVAMPPALVLSTEVINGLENRILEIMRFGEGFEGTYRCITDNNAGDDDGDVVLRLDDPDPGEWSTTPWSACDPDCHRGMRMRIVTCRGVNTRILLPDNRCTEEKPLAMERCLNRGPCFLDPVWVPQDWSACSVRCNGGYRTRNIICQIPRTQEIVMDTQCSQIARPSSFEFCNQQPCCTIDRYPSYCRLIRNSALCNMAAVKANCCWSCR